MLEFNGNKIWNERKSRNDYCWVLDQERSILRKRYSRKIKTYSEETAGIIDEEMKRILDTCYNSAKEILKTHEDKLHAVAKVLLEKEKITGEEFEAIFNEE